MAECTPTMAECRPAMADSKPTAEVEVCDKGSELGDCVICRDMWNKTIPAEILQEKTNLAACVDCVLTERWLQHTVQNSAQNPVKASRLLRQCHTCIAESSGHQWVNWRFCLKCCQHVCGSSLKTHPCQHQHPKLTVTFLIELKAMIWSEYI